MRRPPLPISSRPAAIAEQGSKNARRTPSGFRGCASHGRPARRGRDGGGRRAGAARGGGEAGGRPVAGPRPGCPARDRVRAARRDAVGMLPREAFGCPGTTGWRRLRDRRRAGGTACTGCGSNGSTGRASRAGLAPPRAPRPSGHEGAGRSARTRRTGAGRGRSGTAARSTGAPEHRSTPLGVTPTGANRHDGKALAPIPDAVPGMRSGQRGRPRERPEKRPAPSGDIACRDALPGEGRGLRPPTTPPGVPRSFDRPPDPTPRRRGIRRARARPTGRRARRRPGSRPVPPSRHPPPDPRADSHMASSSPATAIVRTNKARRIRQKTGGAA